MSTDVTVQYADKPAESPVNEVSTTAATTATTERKRPRLDLGSLGTERKRGKSMFGLVLGTLNKAKIEDKERNASEAAKKRQLIEQRLQTKLRKETDSVRRAEEAKKDKTSANRKEEDLQLKDSVYKYRRTRHPLFANFLITSDDITSEGNFTIDSALPKRAHPPPLYYLPAILLPEQEAFLSRRRSEVKEAAEKEWSNFRSERTAGIEEVEQLRQKVAEADAKRKAEKGAEEEESKMDTDQPPETPATENKTEKAEMEVDESGGNASERKEDSAPIQADGDDAVEY